MILLFVFVLIDLYVLKFRNVKQSLVGDLQFGDDDELHEAEGYHG